MRINKLLLDTGLGSQSQSSLEGDALMTTAQNGVAGRLCQGKALVT